MAPSQGYRRDALGTGHRAHRNRRPERRRPPYVSNNVGWSTQRVGRRRSIGARRKRRPEKRRTPDGATPQPSRRAVNATRWPPDEASVHTASGGREKRRPPLSERGALPARGVHETHHLHLVEVELVPQRLAQQRGAHGVEQGLVVGGVAAQQ